MASNNNRIGGAEDSNNDNNHQSRVANTYFTPMRTVANNNGTDNEEFYTPAEMHYVFSKLNVKEEIEPSSPLVGDVKSTETGNNDISDMVNGKVHGKVYIDVNGDDCKGEHKGNDNMFKSHAVFVPSNGTSGIKVSVPLKEVGASASGVYITSSGRESGGASVVDYTVFIKSLRSSASGVDVTLSFKGVFVGVCVFDCNIYIKGIAAGEINGDVTISGRMKVWLVTKSSKGKISKVDAGTPKAVVSQPKNGLPNGPHLELMQMTKTLNFV
jgi:hypothetical protein